MALNFPLVASEMKRIKVSPAEFRNQELVVSRRDKNKINVLSAKEHRMAIGSSAPLSSIVSGCTAGVRQSWTPLTGVLTSRTKILGKLSKLEIK